MTLAWMIYSSIITLLLAFAARSIEDVVAQRGWPARAVWILALLGSILLPVISLVVPSRRDPEHTDSLLSDAPSPANQPSGWPGWTEPLNTSIAPEWSVQLSPWVLALWAIASLLISLGLILSYFLLLHRRRGWIIQEVDGREVWVSPDTGPAVFGFRDSRIVLPSWVLEASESQRALVLAHEEEHLRAGDLRLILGALLVATALPWNLALWWVWRRLRQAVEIDCDHRILARGVDPRTYSRLLMEVTDRGCARHIAVVALSEPSTFLERRVRLMLKPCTRHWTGMVGPITLASLLVAAACQVGQPTPPASERVTLWISPTGTYHLNDPDTEAIPLPSLSGALRTAVSRTGEPAELNVRAYEGAGGYEYIMARRVACEAGVRRIDFAGSLPIGSVDLVSGPAEMRGVEEIRPPCVEDSQQPDTAMAGARRFRNQSH